MLTTLKDFNPHSRKGSDSVENIELTQEEISIHTPARGVTFICNLLNYYIKISIHTPARGVTDSTSGTVKGTKDFNPHSRKGSDGITRVQFTTIHRISIHTPARGVTIAYSVGGGRQSISIHTPARGVTFMLDCCRGLTLFQSTLPQGE